VLDMSDPDHESFADSAADCLDTLLAHEQEIRRILTALAGPPAASATVANIPHHRCHHD